jgi:photosystem II stability/assembly factor-like uncharacterized protein
MLPIPLCHLLMLTKRTHLMRILALLLLLFGIAFAFFQGKTPTASSVPGEPAAKFLIETESQGFAWENISAGLPEKMDPNQILYTDGEFLIGTSDGNLYRSRDPKSGKWEVEHVGDPIAAAVGAKGNPILGIYAGQSGPYVRVYDEGIYQKVLGTESWQPVFQFFEKNTVSDILELADGTVYVATSHGLFVSKNTGQDWKPIYEKGRVSGLRSAEGTLVASVSDGIIRSTDGGATWQTVWQDKGSFYDISPIKGGFAAARTAGPWRGPADNPSLLLSADGGKTWQPTLENPAANKGIYQLIEMDGSLFCSYENALARSTDGGKTWESVYATEESGPPMRLSLIVLGKKLVALLAFGGC